MADRRDRRPVQSAQQAYEALLRQAIAPALRAEGLRGSGAHFHIPDDRYWALVGFQRSVHSTPDEVTFTVNLRIIERETFAAWASLCEPAPAKPSPNTGYGDVPEWWVRLGHYTDSRDDVWWPVLPDAPEANGMVAGDVLDLLRRAALPAVRARLALPNAIRPEDFGNQ